MFSLFLCSFCLLQVEDFNKRTFSVEESVLYSLLVEGESHLKESRKFFEYCVKIKMFIES
jgi:hypothetical protein